jgi:hypothetical protein
MIPALPPKVLYALSDYSRSLRRRAPSIRNHSIPERTRPVKIGIMVMLGC